MKILAENELELIEKGGKCLVDFYADWCGPCKMLGPNLESASADVNALGVATYKINVDDNNAFSIKNAIQYVPTVIFFDGGKDKDRFVGVKTPDEIGAFVKKNL